MRLIKTLISFVVLLTLNPFRVNANKTSDNKFFFTDTTYRIEVLGSLSFCQGNTVKLSVKSNMNFPQNISFQWKNPSILPSETDSTYTTGISGAYSVVISRGIGRDTTLSNVIVTVWPNPIADFSVSQSTICAGVPVFYKDNSTGSISTYAWSFGDTQTSNLPNPSHTFPTSYGNLNINFSSTLTVTNSNGCSNLITKSISVLQRPEAKFFGTTIICTGASKSTFTFNNGSSTIGSNSNYLFDWGDGTNTNISSFNTAQTHQYLIGNNDLTLIVTGNNSCKDTISKVIYLGSNPSAGIASPGNTNICTNSELTFPISNFETNSPGTSYKISFNDGTASLAFTQSNIPVSISHTYALGSCLTTSNGVANSFFAQIEATNPCAATIGTVTPIYVSESPVAKFTISKDTNCVNTLIRITNTSLSYKSVSTSGVCSLGNKVWQITPSTGFTLAIGQTLGNTFGDPNPLNWDNSLTDSLKVIFNTPGTYIIRLTIGGTGSCPPSFIEKTVCINAVPVASFTLDNITGCLPLSVNVTNTTASPNCGINTNIWSTIYTATAGCLPNTSQVSLTGGTTLTSINPQFLFGNPGTYKVQLVVTSPANACTSPVYSLPIVIKSKPTVSAIIAPANICINTLITPTSTIGNCNSSTAASYAWLFPGGSIGSSTSLTPGNITYTSLGSSNMSLEVTNECGTTTVTKNLTVNSLPNAPTGVDNSRCGTGSVTITATAGSGETIDWYSAATGGTLLKLSSNSYTTINISSTTTYYAESKNASGCVSLTRTPVNAIIIPIPALPTIGSNSSICSGSTLNLTSTLIPGVIYSWSGPNGFSSALQNPSIISATTINSGTYSLVVSLNTCSSATVTTTATVKSIPSSPNTNSNTPVCIGNTLNLSATNITGATYAWTGPNNFISTLQNPTIPNVIAASSGTYSVIAMVNGCSNNAANTNVIINSLPSLVITNPAMFCASSSVNLTNSNITIGSSTGLTFSYWNDALASSSLVSPTAVSNAGTYYVKAVNTNSCYVISPVLVTTNPLPNTYSVTGGGTYCSGGVGVPVNLSGSQNGINYQLYIGGVPVGSAVSGTGSSLNFGNQITAGIYTIAATNTVTNCSNNMSNSVTIAINPLSIPTINITASVNTICKGSSVTFTSAITNGGVSPFYQWQKNGINVGSNITSYTDPGLINGDIITCILTASGCSSASTVTSNPITITVNDIPTITSVNANSNCGSGSILLRATNSTGSTNWYSSATGGVLLATGSSFNTPVLLTSKIYYVDATNNNCTTANRTAIVATINSLPQALVISDKSICLGSSTQIGSLPVLGSTYSWTSSPVGFSNNTSNPIVYPTANTIYSLTETITATGCIKTNNVNIIVSPTPTISSSSHNDPTTCAGSDGVITLSGLTASTDFFVSYLYNNIAQSHNLSSNSSGEIILNGLKAGQYTQINVTLGVCFSNYIASITLTDPAAAQAPVASSNGPICSGSNLQLNAGTIANAMYTWTGPNGFTSSSQNPILNNLSTIASGAYSVIASISNCPSIASTVQVNVNPTPTVVITPSSQTICSNSRTNITLSSTVLGAAFNWVVSNNTNVTGASNGSGNFISQTLINTSITTQTITYTVTPAFTNYGITCYGASKDITITVNPTPSVIVTPLNQTICSNTSTSIDLSTLVTGSVFSWSITNNLNISGASAGTGVSIAQTLINSNLAAQSITYSIEPSITNNSVACYGVKINAVVTVNPSASIQFSRSNETICSGSNSSIVMLNSTSSNVNFSWTSSQPIGIAGVISSGTNSIPSQTLVNNSNHPINIQYSSIASSTDVNSCKGPDAIYTVTVNPVPDVIATPTAQTFCSNTATNIALSTTVSGTSFDWSISVNSNISGASNGSGSSIIQTLINNSAVPQILQYTITPKLSNGGINCYGMPITVPITVNPTPQLVGFLIQTSICTNKLFTYNPTSNTPNTIFNWTRAAVTGISNPALLNGTNGISEALVNTTQAPIKVSYNYILTANGCSNNQVVVDTVFSNAKSVFIPDKLIACAPYNLNTHITVSRFPLANDESQYIWLANNIQIGTGLQVPAYIISKASDTVKISLVAKSKYGCTSDTMTQTIYTIEQPIPGFTINSHKACGPVSISFQNTTKPLNVLNNSSYYWDFGNGKSSTSINPGVQIYNSAPNLKDTTYYITLSVTTQCATLKYLDSVLVRPSPKALFTPSSTVGCSPFTVTFRNNSLGANNQGSGMVYRWNFGDGTFDTTNNLNSVNHIYHNGSQKIDTVIVKLFAINECGTDSIQYNIVVFPNTVKPALIINGNERFSCAPLTVHFFNNSTGATRFNWNFGDGSIYTSTKSSDTIIHVFNTPGTFVVTLNATNGCSDTTVSDSVVVYPSINLPDFSIIKTISCLVDSVQFKNNTDTAKMNSFVWDLGDGTTSNSFQLTHQYKLPGIFNVSLLASKTYITGVTCSSSAVKTVQILNNPTAIFTSNDNGLNCSPFNYIVNTTPNLAGSAEWLFSDPTSLDTVAIGFSASHLYRKAGTYRVRLKVSNQNGCSDSAVQTVRVTDSPIANINYADSIICTKNSNSKTINFINTTTYLGDNLIKYEWLIDGVLASTSSNSLSHIFTANSTEVLPKLFNVTLKAISSIGCSTSKTVTISFIPYPKASIIVSKVASCSNAIITASDNETKIQHLRKWTWTSNNPNAPLLIISNDTSSNIAITIPTNNTNSIIDYNLILNVVSGGACADSVSQKIRIYPKPKVDFSIKDTICSNADYILTNLSDSYLGGNSSSMGFTWFVKKYIKYGDTVITNFLTNINPTINLSNSGVKDSIYFINLIGSSPFGCIDSSTYKIVVHPSTFARFTSSPSISCTPLTLFIQSNTSQNAASFAWYINNVFYSNSKVPDDTILTKSGIRYNLKLVATNPYGCLSDSLISVITTYIAPTSKFNVSQTSSCSGSLQVNFYNASVGSGTNINTWFWDFGDGTTSTIPNPVHQYNLPGSYNVSLNVQDGRGCFSDTASLKNIIIYSKPTANYLADNVCFGDSVHFVNLSQLGFGSTQFDKVFWNFGDGTNSSIFSPSHLYKGPGTYTITLTILSDKSCIADTIIKKVTVFGKPKADFSWDISCVNMPIIFTNLSVPGFGEVALSKNKWDFGNGLTSNLFSPHIQYFSTGVFQISLIVNNAICSNLADTIYKPINIFASRKGISYPRVEAVYGEPKPLHALSGGISYNWNPAIGLDYSNIKDPIAIYDNRVANKINYSILIRDSAGCVINDFQEVFIFLKPAIYAPSAFIVDGSDPLNRRFLPHYININRLVNFRILDRWGVEQFSTSDMSKYWEGNDKNGNPLPLETYIWIAVGVGNNGNQVIGKGNITLIRNGN